MFHNQPAIWTNRFPTRLSLFLLNFRLHVSESVWVWGRDGDCLSFCFFHGWSCFGSWMCVCGQALELWGGMVGVVWLPSSVFLFLSRVGFLFFNYLCDFSILGAIQIVTFVGGGVNSIFFFGHFLYLKLLWLHCVCVCVCNTQQVDTKWRRWFLPMCPPLSLVFMSLVSTSLPFNLRYRHKIRCVVLPAHSKWTVYERIRNLHKMLNQISRCP